MSRDVTSAGRSTRTQCQKPLGVGASGSKQVTTYDLVPSGAPSQDSCGEVLPELGDLVVLEGLAVGHVAAGDREGRRGGQELVGVGGYGALDAHSPNLVRNVVSDQPLARGGSCFDTMTL